MDAELTWFFEKELDEECEMLDEEVEVTEEGIFTIYTDDLLIDHIFKAHFSMHDDIVATEWYGERKDMRANVCRDHVEFRNLGYAIRVEASDIENHILIRVFENGCVLFEEDCIGVLDVNGEYESVCVAVPL